MKVVVIDDEPGARKGICDMLRHFCKNVELAGEAESVRTGIDVVKRAQPDLVLLDIELKDGSGFELLSALRPFAFKVIFITAHEEFAIKAFRFSALDYLVKPVDPDDLVSAIERAEKAMNTEGTLLRLEALLCNIHNQSRHSKKLVLKTAENLYVITLRDIIRCESDRNYTTFFLADGRKMVVSRTLKEYEEMLAEMAFFRVHQSHLVNLEYITSFEKKDGGHVIMTDGSCVPVASRKKELLLQVLERL